MLGCKSYSGLYGNVYGQNSLGSEQSYRPEGNNEYCSPEITNLSEAVEGIIG